MMIELFLSMQHYIGKLIILTRIYNNLNYKNNIFVDNVFIKYNIYRLRSDTESESHKSIFDAKILLYFLLMFTFTLLFIYCQLKTGIMHQPQPRQHFILEKSILTIPIQCMDLLVCNKNEMRAYIIYCAYYTMKCNWVIY